MKRLLILTIIGTTMIATTGCGCCGSLFNRNQNACAFNASSMTPSGCSTCGEGQVMTSGSAVTFDGGGLLPPPTTTLPGPQS